MLQGMEYSSDEEVELEEAGERRKNGKGFKKEEGRMRKEEADSGRVRKDGGKMAGVVENKILCRICGDGAVR